MPVWIGLRTPEDGHVTTARAPLDPVTTDALVKAARQVRAGPTRALPESRSSTYVVLIELAAHEYGLYVGSTGLTPDERYLNHKRGHKASRWVRRYGIRETSTALGGCRAREPESIGPAPRHPL